jgi:hypothetical protein
VGGINDASHSCSADIGIINMLHALMNTDI